MSQARIATARTTYTLDIDPYNGHVVLFDTIAYTGVDREQHFDTDSDAAVKRLLELVEVDIRASLARAPWVEV